MSLLSVIGELRFGFFMFYVFLCALLALDMALEHSCALPLAAFLPTARYQQQ